MSDKLEDVNEYIELIKNIHYEAAEHGFNKSEIKKLISRENFFDGSLKLGLIGTGAITVNAIRALRQVANITPFCVMSRNIARAELFSEQQKIPKFTDNLFGLVINGCNAVYVASRTEAHFTQVRNLLFLGVHVICEKPITVYPYELTELVNIAKKRGLILMEAWKTRHVPLYQDLQRVFSSANGLGPDNENSSSKVQKINIKFYYSINKKDVVVDKSYNTLLKWRTNFCDIYFYPISMAIGLTNQADLSSFNIQSVVTGFTSTYALKCGWLSLYGDIEIQITVAAIYNEPNVPRSTNVITSNNGKIVFTSITNIGSIQEYDKNSKLINERSVDFRKYNFEYMIEEFRKFSKLYYTKDLGQSFRLLRENREVNKIMHIIFSNTFNLFSNKFL